MLKKVKENLIKFFSNNLDIYRKIQSYLSENNIEFFILKLKNECPRKVLIIGIPIYFPISEIRDEMIALG